MDKCVAILEKVAQQRHIIALRDGMISSVPIILVGSTFLLLGSQEEIIESYFSGNVSWLPNIAASAFGRWYAANSALIFRPYRLTMGLMSLYIAFTIAVSLARQYKLPPLPQGLGAVATLLVTNVPYKAPDPDGSGQQWVIPLRHLGAEGIFMAIFMGLAMVEISRLFLRPGSADKKPSALSDKAIPPSVAEAFNSFLPMLTLVSLIWLVRHVAGLDIHAALLWLMEPMKQLGDSLTAVLVSNFFMHLFVVAGVHGISIINAVMLPLWQQFVAANAEAHSLGLPLPHVTAYPFYQWFIWTGGGGSTLAATIILLFSKKTRLKTLGKISLIPALFNINEPLLFGLPVVANPVMAIPCILAPMACGLTSWFAVSSGLVGAPFLEVPWVMPCFLGAPLSTQDARSLLLLAFNLFISGAIWYPFLRRIKE